MKNQWKMLWRYNCCPFPSWHGVRIMRANRERDQQPPDRQREIDNGYGKTGEVVSLWMVFVISGTQEASVCDALMREEFIHSHTSMPHLTGHVFIITFTKILYFQEQTFYWETFKKIKNKASLMDTHSRYSYRVAAVSCCNGIAHPVWVRE